MRRLLLLFLLLLAAAAAPAREIVDFAADLVIDAGGAMTVTETMRAGHERAW